MTCVSIQCIDCFCISIPQPLLVFIYSTMGMLISKYKPFWQKSVSSLSYSGEIQGLWASSFAINAIFIPSINFQWKHPFLFPKIFRYEISISFRKLIGVSWHCYQTKCFANGWVRKIYYRHSVLISYMKRLVLQRRASF